MKPRKETISVELVRKLLHYSPETGAFTWKMRTPDMFSHVKRQGRYAPEVVCQRWNTTWAGRVAGAKCPKGYIRINVNYNLILAHRLAMFITSGEWPEDDVDHINMVKDDNRICNLRLATRSENKSNTIKQRNNSTGFKGVVFCKVSGMYYASVKKGRIKYKSAYYSTAEEAHADYCDTAKQLFGEFARTA